MKINLGSGLKKKEGFINIDIDKDCSPDMVHNIERGLPFDNNSVSYIYSSHFLEHIKPDKYIFVLNEIQRVAKDGCILELRLPFDHIGTRTFVAHFRTYGFNSFDRLEIDKHEVKNWYTDLALRRLDKKPFITTRLFYYMFPFLKDEIRFMFEIVKGVKE